MSSVEDVPFLLATHGAYVTIGTFSVISSVLFFMTIALTKRLQKFEHIHLASLAIGNLLSGTGFAVSGYHRILVQLDGADLQTTPCWNCTLTVFVICFHLYSWSSFATMMLILDRCLTIILADYLSYAKIASIAMFLVTMMSSTALLLGSIGDSLASQKQNCSKLCYSDDPNSAWFVRFNKEFNLTVISLTLVLSLAVVLPLHIRRVKISPNLYTNRQRKLSESLIVRVCCVCLFRLLPRVFGVVNAYVEVDIHVQSCVWVLSSLGIAVNFLVSALAGKAVRDGVIELVCGWKRIMTRNVIVLSNVRPVRSITCETCDI